MKYKFEIGEKVEVAINDIVFKGLSGIINLRFKDEEGNAGYILKNIETPKMIDKDGKEYEFKKSLFYESWLKKLQ
jgi:hypothetical protein